MTEWNWPPEMEGPIAAPEHHHLLMENDQVRVIDTRIPAGEKTRVHTHRCPGVYYTLSFSHFIRRDKDDTVLFDSRTVADHSDPTAFLDSLAPHTVENVGQTDLHVVSVEIKRAV
jgi:hypothetical protein